jgi:hypothetical protein
MQIELTPKGAIHLAVEQSAVKASKLIDSLICTLSNRLEMQMIDLRYGRAYRDNFIDEIIKEN